MATGVMVIAPHPDDAEIGMGGTLAALVQAGCRVMIVDLSDGEPTPYGSRAVRLEESARASSILGVRERRLLDLPNREIFDTAQNRKKVAGVIREFKPHLLFVPYWEDAHPDHVTASALGDAARFYAKLVKCGLPGEPHYPRKTFYYFPIHLNLKLQPDFVYNISDHFERKLEALGAFRSQFVDNPQNSSVFEKLRTVNAYWGLCSGCRYAEPFVCREPIRLAEQ